MKHPDESVPDYVKFVLCVLMSLLLGLLDYLTGDFSLLMFYLIPIGFASWFIGKRAGFFVSFLCAALLITDYLLTPAFSSMTRTLWNAFMEGCFLVLTAFLLSKIRTVMQQVEKRSAEVDAANRELDAFNYSVAHDLRTPLSIINGYVQLIQEMCGSELSESCREFVDNIFKGCTRMTQTIESLLRFSRMGRVALERMVVDLSGLALEIAGELSRTEPERNVQWSVATDIAASGDPALLRIALENLMGNAWKYTGPRPEAVIEFGATGTGEKKVYYIRDNGIGFDQKEAEKLFLPFHRLRRAEDFKGFGIGLATVERIIQRHSGRIWAEGEPGKGATIYFTLSDEPAHPV